MIIELKVVGKPQTQGSKTPFKSKGGNVVLVEGRRPASRAAFADWRRALADESVKAFEQNNLTELLAGPLEVHLAFSLTRPASHPKRRRTWPIGAHSGDVDKLTRAVLDGITGTLIRDDSQVITVVASKDWGDPPGVVVSITEISDEELT